MDSFANIRAVTFDVGGTLIEPWPSVGHIYEAVAAGHGFNHLSVEKLNRRFAIAWQARGRFDYSESAWAELVDETFAGLIESIPSLTFFPELYRRFASAEVWRVYEDVGPALETLAKRGLPLGIISNWDQRLSPLMRQLGLDRHFQHLAISSDIGVAKPSGAIFDDAVRNLGVAADLILHVGDSVREDVEGARSAGLRAVLIRRDGLGSGGDQIVSLNELECLLAS